MEPSLESWELPTRVDRGVHLVLGAGGARAIAYVGALEVLERARVPISTVSGCSAGAVVAVLVASGLDAKSLREIVLAADLDSFIDTARSSRLRQLSALRRWPFAPRRAPGVDRFIDAVLTEASLGDSRRTLGELAVPFASLAIDLVTSDFAVFSSHTHPNMTISDVIGVATALPFVFPPRAVGRQMLVDAAIASSVPVWITAVFPELRPIVALRTKPTASVTNPRRLRDFTTRLFESIVVGRDETFMADNAWVHCVEIDPAGVSMLQVGLDNAEKERLMQVGYDAMRRYLDGVGGELLPMARSTLEAARSPDVGEGIKGARLVHNFRRSAQRPRQLFISFPHADRRSFTEIRGAIEPLEDGGLISIWTDEDIAPGENWDTAIRRAINRADVALLLVSDDFFRSNYIQATELPEFLQQAERGRTELLWVPLEPLADRATAAELQRLQAAWDPARPLSTLGPTDTNQALDQIVRAVVLAVQRSVATPPTHSPSHA